MGKFNKNRQRGQFWNKNAYKGPIRGDVSGPKCQEFVVKDCLKEDQVGITEYVLKGDGFKGILKSRFSDFQVNEIDLNGDVLQLNDLTVPDEKEQEMSAEEVNSVRDELKNVFSEDICNKMCELKDDKHDMDQTPEDSAIIIDVSALDKVQRTQAHKLIKTIYNGKLMSSTVKGENAGCEDPDKKFIRVIKSWGGGHDRKKWVFPKDCVHFLVHKENMDTSEVASSIAKKLNMRVSQVNYCGTKDKRAKTTQKFSVKKRTPRQIVDSVKFLNGVRVGNFKFKKSCLRLGDLHGNRFRIAIRNLIGERQHIEILLNAAKEQGFINYFGLQRFGNCSAIPTYEIGVALLKADYKLACELILKPRNNDSPFLKSIREAWWKDRNSKKAAALIHGEAFLEKKLLEGLAQYGGKDYASALRKIPRNMLLLYPHAFQSLIFNNVASKRIKEFGLSVIPGDLVYRFKDYREVEGESNELPEQEDNLDKETENETTPAVDDTYTKNIFRRKVKAITEEDIASASYTIYDVLLPLPGHDITYPENVVGSWYKEFMAKYDLSSEKLKHNVKLFAMAGAYRRLVVKPRDMSWEFKYYSTPEENLILSDLEVLEGKNLENIKQEEDALKYEALLLNFSLPTASYATMMLRELLKCDTSAAAQSLLQQEALKEHTTATEIKEEVDKDEVSGEKRKASDSEFVEESVKPTKLLKTCEQTNELN